MAILKKIYLLLLPLLLSGCYEDFIPDIDTRPVLCLNSLIVAGEPLDISVTRTWAYTDTEAAGDHSVSDAALTIFVNGESRPLDYIPREGDCIRIIADSPTYGSAEAEVTVPVCVPIESLDWDAEVFDCIEWTLPDETYDVYRINLKAQMAISDPAATVNYYDFTYDTFPDTESDEDALKFYTGTFIYEAEPIFSEHIGVLDAISGSDSFGFTFFTDRSFSGATYTLNLRFENIACQVARSQADDALPDCGFVFHLNSVSPSYYNWCIYQWNVENGTIGDLNDIGLGDPVWAYSNVSSGAGVVAAIARASYTIPLNESLEKYQQNEKD